MRGRFRNFLRRCVGRPLIMYTYLNKQCDSCGAVTKCGEFAPGMYVCGLCVKAAIGRFPEDA